MKTIRDVSDIVAWRLCLGCGACAYICPEKKISLFDVVDEGVRPSMSSACEGCRLCVDVCPGVENDRTAPNSRPGILRDLLPSCGPVFEVWEGYASDAEIRFLGSSGGAITALSLFCLEAEGMHGVLQTSGDPSHPWLNSTRMSHNRTELLAGTGSRYAPASVCNGLHLVEDAPKPCVVVGQPSEISALKKAEPIRPNLASNVGLTISFFCAGSPSTKGTLDLLASFNVKPKDVAEVRYRGRGWPGMFSIRRHGKRDWEEKTTYTKAWRFLTGYRPLSVHLCPDGTGEDADITCGDPWYRPIESGEHGTSLIMIRTDRGKRLFDKALQLGYIKAKRLSSREVLDAQKSLFAKRGSIWGRLLALRLFGLPTPRLKGFYLWKSWLRLPFDQKARSIVGTVRRIFSKGWNKPFTFDPAKVTPVKSPVANSHKSSASVISEISPS